MPPKKSEGQLTEEALKELSRLQNEPSWLLEKRLEAFTLFESSPLPSLQAGLGVMSSPITFTDIVLTPVPPQFSLPDGLPAGVEAFPFSAAPAVLRTRLFRLIDPRDKLSAFSAAFYTSGLFIRIPANLHCTEPLSIHASTIQRTVLLVEEGASATVIETPSPSFTSPTPEKLNVHLKKPTTGANASLPATQATTNTDTTTSLPFSSVAAEVFAGPSSQLRYASLPGPVFSVRRAVVSRDASLNWFHAEQNRQGQSVHAETSTLLDGEGASTTVTGLFSGSGSFDLRASAFHRAPHTISDMLFRGALAGGKALVRGLVKIHQTASSSSGCQKGDILLLGSGCEAAVIPDLEIDNNDVRCTHGATVSRPDAEKLFYLQSRGLPPAEALSTLVSGFFTSALVRFPVPAAADAADALARNMEDAL